MVKLSDTCLTSVLNIPSVHGLPLITLTCTPWPCVLLTIPIFLARLMLNHLASICYGYHDNHYLIPFVRPMTELLLTSDKVAKEDGNELRISI